MKRTELDDFDEDYDGIYFLPNIKKKIIDGFFFLFFVLPEKYKGGQRAFKEGLGDVYHIILVENTKDNTPVYKEHFEAIIGDPRGYIKRMADINLYGCLLKKTDKTHLWVENYVEYLKR